MLLISTVFLLIFSLLDLYISDRGVLESPNVLVDHVYLLAVISVFTSYILTLLLGAYILRIVMSF